MEKTRDELLKWIAANPAEVLDDMTMLRQELTTEKIMLEQTKKRLRISEFVAQRYAARLHEAKKQLRLCDAIFQNRKV